MHPLPAGRLLILGIVLIAANLRASLTAVGPLLDRIQHGRGLSESMAGLLNTLPLLAFAAFSPVAVRLGRRLGRERTLLAALVVLTVGTVVRSLPTAVALFAGTIVVGLAIAAGNVLLPQLVKERFPDRVGVLTGVYAATMGLVAAVSSGVAVPIADHAPAGWPTALGCWAGLAVLAAVVWRPTVRTAVPPTSRGALASTARTWRSALAWQVTGFMGLQSLGFYVVIAWLPSVLSDHGVARASAGWILFGYQAVALLTTVVVPLALRGRPDQRWLTAVSALCSAAGFAGLAVAPGLYPLWVLLAGLGGGACLVLALSFIGLRAATAAQTAALSGMAQSIGYLLAAVGPVLFGVLHDHTGGWTVPLLSLTGVGLACAAAGFGAGRARHVGG